MSAGPSTVSKLDRAPAPAEPVDPAIDLSAFQHMLGREIPMDRRPGEWDGTAWVFTGIPGHLGTLVNRCRFPGCHGPSFTRRSELCNVCTGRQSRHTKRMGAMSAEAWINRAVELQGTHWAARVVPILCSVSNGTNRSKGLGVPLMAATEGNPKRWHQQKDRLPPLCLGHQPHGTIDDIQAWIASQATKPVAPPEYCAVPWCGYKRHPANQMGVCRLHAQLIKDQSELARTSNGKPSSPWNLTVTGKSTPRYPGPAGTDSTLARCGGGIRDWPRSCCGPFSIRTALASRSISSRPGPSSLRRWSSACHDILPERRHPRPRGGSSPAFRQRLVHVPGGARQIAGTLRPLVDQR